MNTKKEKVVGHSAIQLIHGDCLKEMFELPDNSVDMVCCDMPYG